MDSKRIVIVDDDAQMLEMIRSVLGRHYTLMTVNNPAEALDAILSYKPDLVLLDLNMPETSGWAIYNAMQDEYDTRDIPVIIMTASTDKVDRVFGLHIAHVASYLAKPFVIEDLLSAISKALEPPPD